MITILHGDNVVASRKFFADLIQTAKKNGDVQHIDGSKLTVPVLEQLLGGQGLFVQTSLLAIEGMFSFPKGKQKDLLLQMLAGATQDVVLWEKKLLTLTDLKKFPAARIQPFKTSRSMFQWLDSMRPNNQRQILSLLQKAVEQDGAELCFVMLARQVRLLIHILSGNTPAIAPFVVTKLKQQATLFTLEKLTQIHDKLVMVDEQQKTSQSAMTLAQQLDLLMLEI